MGHNPKYPGYNYWKSQGDKYIFNVYAYSFHHHRRCWPTSMLCRVSFSLMNVLWYPLISQCTCLYDVPGTHNVGLPTQYRFNVGPASQPIAVSMPANHTRRWLNIEQNRVVIPCLLWLPYECTDALDPVRPLLGKHDILAQMWSNVGPRSATLGQHYSNQNPWVTNIIVNIFFSEDFLNTKVLSLGTSNVLLHMFIRTGVNNVNRFPQTAPLSPLNKTQTQAK